MRGPNPDAFGATPGWLPGYLRWLLGWLAVMLVIMGAGIALCGPIYAAFLPGEAHGPNTPLDDRVRLALHLRIVSRVTLAGLILFALGLILLALHAWLARRSPAPEPPPR